MLKQFSALMSCALAALCLAVAADSKPEAPKPEPKMIEPKPLDPAIEIKVLRARSAAQEAAAASQAWIAERQKAMLLDAQFQAHQTRERQAGAEYSAALEEARKASGAPKECDFTVNGKWIKWEREEGTYAKQVDCLIPDPPAELKTGSGGQAQGPLVPFKEPKK